MKLPINQAHESIPSESSYSPLLENQFLTRQNLTQLGILVLLWAWMSFIFLGARPWSSRGEPREALVAQSMLQEQNFVLGEGYGGIVPSKPPVLHWSAIAVAKLGTGEITEFAMRAPSSLAALAVIVAVFFLSLSILPTLPPLLAPLILASSFEFFRSGIEARVDMLLCAAMFGTVLASFKFLTTRTVFSLLTASSLLALAILVKGPVGLILPCAAVTVFCWLEQRRFWRPFALLVPVITAVGIAGIWYFEAYQIAGDEFFQRVKYENVLRFLGTQEDEPHKHSAFYLFAMLLVGFLPWTILFLSALFSSLMSALKLKTIRTGSMNWYSGLPEHARLLVYWAGIVLVFFCIPASKRGVYLLPMYPALAILAAAILVKSVWVERLVTPLFKTVGVVFSLAALACISLKMGVVGGSGVANNPVVALSLLSEIFAQSAGPGIVSRVFEWFALVVLFASGVVLVFQRKILTQTSKLEVTVMRCAVLFCLGLGALHGGILPSVAKWLTPQQFAEQLKLELQLAPAKSIISFHYEFYGLSFYLNQRISRAEVLAPQTGDVVVMHEARRAEFDKFLAQSNLGYEFVARSINAIDEPNKKVLAVRITGIRENGVD